MDKKEYFEKVKALREAAGLSRADFCERFAIPARTVLDWDNGKATPPIWVSRMLVKLFENSGNASDDMVQMQKAGIEFSHICWKHEGKAFYELGKKAFEFNEWLGSGNIIKIINYLLTAYTEYEEPMPDIIGKIYIGAGMTNEEQIELFRAFLCGALTKE